MCNFGLICIDAKATTDCDSRQHQSQRNTTEHDGEAKCINIEATAAMPVAVAEATASVPAAVAELPPPAVVLFETGQAGIPSSVPLTGTLLEAFRFNTLSIK